MKAHTAALALVFALAPFAAFAQFSAKGDGAFESYSVERTGSDA